MKKKNENSKTPEQQIQEWINKSKLKEQQMKENTKFFVNLIVIIVSTTMFFWLWKIDWRLCVILFLLMWGNNISQSYKYECDCK